MHAAIKILFIGMFFYIIPFYSFSENHKVYSESYNECIKRFNSFPQIFDCMDIEIEKQIEINEKFISKYKDIASSEDGTIVDLGNFLKDQYKYIDDKCNLLYHVGGQSGVLLQKQCVWDESILLQKFLFDFVKAIDA
jgi:hypothetical protein